MVWLKARVRARTLVLLVLWCTAQVLLPVAPAAAHAFLESSEPTANAVVPTAPRVVTLRFTEPLENSYSRAELVDQTGTPVSGASSIVGPDPRTITVTIPPGLQNGTYSLLWRSLSTADGHTAQGYLPFTIGTRADIADVGTSTQESLSALIPDWVYAVTRWLTLLGEAAVLAVWPVWLFVVRPAIAPVWQIGPKVTRLAHRYLGGAFLFAFLANLAALVVQGMAISGPSQFLAGVPTVLSDTRYGTWWMIRMGLLLLFAATLFSVPWWWPWRRRAETLLAVVMGATLPLPYAMMSHAGAQSVGRETALAFDYAHLLGASLWAGGLLFLIVVMIPTLGRLTGAGQRVVLGRALPRFSLLALVAWGVMALTGFYSAWLQVGSLPALTDTQYGQTLILKLLLIVPLLGLGAFNLLIVTRKLRAAETASRVEGWGRHFVTALAAEVVIVTLLLGVVGLLIGTPTARQVMEQQAVGLRIPLASAGQTGTLIITPGTVGQNRYQLELGSGHESHLANPSLSDASIRLELPERQTGQLDVQLASAPAGGYEAQGSELAFPGTWQLQVTVREPGQPDWVARVETALRADSAPVQAPPPPPPVFAPSGVAGLLLLILGIATCTSVSPVGRTLVFRNVRRVAAGLGVAALVTGVMLLLQARVPATVASIDAPGDLASLNAPGQPARDAPGPEECTVAPRTLKDLEALALTPAPVGTPNVAEPGGEPADAATRAAITSTAREVVACSNAGDLLRRLALYSDDRLRLDFPDGPPAPDVSVTSPRPLPEAQRSALVSVEDIRQLADGRVSALVTVDTPAGAAHDAQAAARASQQAAARLIFIREAGRWRVDGIGSEDT